MPSALSWSPFVFASIQATSILPFALLKFPKPTSIISSIPSLSESKSNTSATPSKSKSHKACVIKISSKAKSFPKPPVSLLIKVTLKASTFKFKLAVNWYQSPAKLPAVVGGIFPVLIEVKRLLFTSLNSTLTFGRNLVAIPGASVLSIFNTQKLYVIGIFGKAPVIEAV